MGRTHPNVIKLRKQRHKGRRAYLKPYFGLIKTRRKIGTSDIPEDQLPYFEYGRRARGYWDAYLESKWPSRGQVSKQRQEIIDRLNRITMEGSSEEFEPDVDVIVVRRGGITKTIIKFFYTSDYKLCYFMKEDWIEMVIHRSGSYGSKDRAMWAFEHDKINWLEAIPIPTDNDPG